MGKLALPGLCESDIESSKQSKEKCTLYETVHLPCQTEYGVREAFFGKLHTMYFLVRMSEYYHHHLKLSWTIVCLTNEGVIVILRMKIYIIN